MPTTNESVFMVTDFVQGDQNIRPIKDCLPYSDKDVVFRGSECYRRRHPQDFLTLCKDHNQSPDPLHKHTQYNNVFADKCHDNEFCVDGQAPHSPNQHGNTPFLKTAYCISSPAYMRIDNDRSGKKHTFINSITGDLAHTPQPYTFAVVLSGAHDTDTFFANIRIKVNDKLGNELRQVFCETTDDDHKCRHMSMDNWPDGWDHFTTEIRFPHKRGPKSVGIFWAVVEMGTGFEEFGIGR